MTETTWCAYRDGVVIPGLATVRLPDAIGQGKVKNGPRHTRYVRTLYIAAGMNVWQWKKLRPVDREMIRWAYNALMAPSNCGREPDPIDWHAFEAWFGREYIILMIPPHRNGFPQRQPYAQIERLQGDHDLATLGQKER